MIVEEHSVKYTLFIPAIVAHYALAEVEEALTYLKKRQQDVEAQDDPNDWPDDYDPNDIGLYECLLPSLKEGQQNGYEERYWWGKPFYWLMSNLRGALQRKQGISKEDKILIARTLCEYYIKTSFCYVLDHPCSTANKSESELAQTRAWSEQHCVNELIKLIANLMNEKEKQANL